MKTYEKILDDLKSRDLLRLEKTLSSYQDVKVIYEERPLHLMGSNNYLSLNHIPELNAFTKAVIDDYGTGAGGSRLTTGSTDWHAALENRLAEFKACEASLVFASGYMANLGVITALAHRESHIFSDRDNHASIVDGILLSQAKFSRYKHLDLKDLEGKLASSPSDHKIVITDTVFSMDGSMADLKNLIPLCRAYKALLIVDDAHGLGVLGARGQGLSEHLGLDEGIDLTIGTLSKAVPASGGYVTGSKLLIDLIKNKARPYIFSTAPPAHLMATAYKALEIIQASGHRRRVLQEKITFFIDTLNKGGLKVAPSTSPIVPIIIGEAQKTMVLQDLLLEDSIYMPGIRPPTVKKGTSRLRASLNYNHSYQDLAYIADRLIYHCRHLEIIGV